MWLSPPNPLKPLEWTRVACEPCVSYRESQNFPNPKGTAACSNWGCSPAAEGPFGPHRLCCWGRQADPSWSSFRVNRSQNEPEFEINPIDLAGFFSWLRRRRHTFWAVPPRFPSLLQEGILFPSSSTTPGHLCPSKGRYYPIMFGGVSIRVVLPRFSLSSFLSHCQILILIFWSILVSLCMKASQLSGDEALNFSYTSHSSIKCFSGTFVSHAFLDMRK